jgi:hypothetical protein
MRAAPERAKMVGSGVRAFTMSGTLTINVLVSNKVKCALYSSAAPERAEMVGSGVRAFTMSGTLIGNVLVSNKVNGDALPFRFQTPETDCWEVAKHHAPIGYQGSGSR